MGARGPVAILSRSAYAIIFVHSSKTFISHDVSSVNTNDNGYINIITSYC
jgi:hypothetical protein